MRTRFFNAYDAAAPFFRNLMPYMISNEDHQVEIVMSKAKYRSGDDFERAVSLMDGIKIVEAANLGLQPSNTVTKFFVLLVYLIHASVYSLVSPSVDLNVFLTQPPLFSFWGNVLSKIRHQPYCCVVMDIYPNLAVELGMMRRHSVWTFLLGWLSAFTLRKANYVVVIGRCMAEHVKSMGVSEQKIHLIPNWADEKNIYPVEHTDNHFRKSRWWKNKFVVLYAGNIGIPQYFDDILTIAERMQNEGNSNIVFVFIGEGSRYKELERRSCALENIALMTFQHEVHSLAEILSAGDLHFVPLREEVTGLAVPSKTYSILAAGRPIIYQGSEHSEIARMITEEGVGAVVRCGDVEDLRRSILSYASRPKLCRNQGFAARSLAEGVYSREHRLSQYNALFSSKSQSQELVTKEWLQD